MTEAEIRKLAAEVLGDIAPEADPDTLSDDEDLREALDLDSMDFLNFVIALNERTGVEVPEADYGEVNTVAKAVAYLNGHGAAVA